MTSSDSENNSVAVRGKPLRILYVAGPGDVVRTYRFWAKGEPDPTQVAMTSSGMFYDECRELGASAYVIGTNRRAEVVCDSEFRVEHRPTPLELSGGILYHLGQIWAGLRLVASAVWFRADVAVIVCGTSYWFVFWLLPLFGIKVVSSLHCVLWAKYRPISRAYATIRTLNATFLRNGAFRILSMSDDITKQVVQVTRGKQAPVTQFLPTYRLGQFADITPANPTSRPFRVCFAGRVERIKGVYDLLAVALKLYADGLNDIEFDVCGTGSALDELRRRVEAAGISARFRCHGHCNWLKMKEIYGAAHVVIAPTTGGFTEGFNQVVAEAILAGRPVITSDVCPAIAYVRDAVVEVPVDDVDANVSAIRHLYNDADFYQTKCQASLGAQAQFYNVEQGWQTALHKALKQLRPAPAESRECEPADREPAIAQ